MFWKFKCLLLIQLVLLKSIGLTQNSINSNVKLSINWTKENATLTLVNYGAEIQFASDEVTWKKFCDEGQPAYCYYKFLDQNQNMGFVYNFAAIRNLAPDGYRIPTKADFDSLNVKLKRSKSSNSLCQIVPKTACSNCSTCKPEDYNNNLGFNLEPRGWLYVTKSNKTKWKENGEDMYLWFMDSVKNSNNPLSGLGMAQFKVPSTIRMVNLNEINNVGSKPELVKKEDFEYIEKYFGTFVRLISEKESANEVELILKSDNVSTTVFKEVKIGSQIWMTGNLNVDRFRNGDLIPEARTNAEWEQAGKDGKPAWCYYNNNSLNGSKYGKLYNWHAVNDPRGLAPVGWHIPSDEEWIILTTFLGGESVAGDKMKSNSGWIDNSNGKNSSGFFGLPGGVRANEGNFGYIGCFGFWWTSKKIKERFASSRYLSHGIYNISRLDNTQDKGFSVRCVKD